MQSPSTKILIYLLALFSCICISGLCNILYVISFSAFLFSNVSFMKAGSLVCFSPCYSVRLEQHPMKVLDKPLVGRFDTAPGAQSVSVTASLRSGPLPGLLPNSTSSATWPLGESHGPQEIPASSWQKIPGVFWHHLATSHNLQIAHFTAYYESFCLFMEQLGENTINSKIPQTLELQDQS